MPGGGASVDGLRAPSPGAPERDWSRARVMVTGASGFLGAALVERLAAAGCDLHCIGRQPARDRPGSSPRGTWWQLDLTHRDATARVIDAIRPEYVFHLASHVTGSRDARAVMPLFHGECAATVNLLEALLGVGCRRVVCSGSMEEPSGVWDDVTVASPYAAAKSASRIYQKLFDQLYELPIVNARIAMAYGPGQRDRTKLVPYVIESLRAGKAPRLSDGGREADWIYIDDVIDALIRLASAESARGLSIDVGTGTLTSVRAVVERLQGGIGSTATPAFGALPTRPLEQAPRADAERTRRLTGWSARVGLDEGLRRTARFHSSSEGSIAAG